MKRRKKAKKLPTTIIKPTRLIQLRKMPKRGKRSEGVGVVIVRSFYRFGGLGSSSPTPGRRAAVNSLLAHVAIAPANERRQAPSARCSQDTKIGIVRFHNIDL